MKKLLGLLIVGVVLASLVLTSCTGSSSTSAPANAIKVTVATDATWRPFEYVDDQTKAIVGFEIDLMKAIAAKENINAEFKDVPWDPLLAGMAQGTYDAAISSITITPDRQKAMLFSDPYWLAGQLVIVQKSNNTIKDNKTLTGDVGVQLGTTGDLEVQKITGAKSKPYDTIDLAFLDLINGQINAVVCDNPVAMYYVNQYSDKIKAAGPVFTNEGYGIAVAKGKTDLLARFNDGIKAVKNDGTMDKLAAQWKVK
jgi:polar amino acid transport system substrate-binding protein